MWLWLLGVALAGEFAVEASPTTVTVYRAQARVTRSAPVRLPIGRHQVVFAGLPASVVADSVTAAVSGGAEVDGVDTRRIPARQVADERVKVLEEELKRLGSEKQALNDDRASYEAELAAIVASRTAAAAQLNQQLLVADKAPERVAATLAALRTEEDRARAGRRSVIEQIAEKDREIAALQRERQQLGSSATDTWTATVNLEVKRAGTVNVSLDTLVTGAGWLPVYDLRGDGTGDVELALSARVRQSSGEDWSDVALTVSSAEPGRGTDAPRLDPFWLQRYMPRPQRASRAKASAAVPQAAPSMAMSDKDMGMAEMALPPPEPMEVAVAVVEQQLSATSFSVERAEDVPSDGTWRKVLLTTVELEADLRHVVVPRVDPKAYLVGEVTNSAGFPLLAGEAGVFLDGAYVGTFDLPMVAPGDEFDVAFGVDDRLTVTRKPQRIEVGKGQPGKKAKATWEWVVTVQNGHKGPVDVEVLEQVPLSRSDEIEVALTGDEPSEQDAQGRLTFRDDVAARGSRTFTWGYQVTYPSELMLGWME